MDLFLPVIGFISLVIWYLRGIDREKWNKGHCDRCFHEDGKLMSWTKYDTDSHGGRLYKCNLCGRHISIIWGVDKNYQNWKE
jgi:hypothetical protein